MSLKPEELVEMGPDLQKLASAITEALRKDADGKTRVTKEEAAEIKKLVIKLGIRLAKEAID